MKLSSRTASAFLALTAAVFPAAAQTTGANSYVQVNLVGNAKTIVPTPAVIDPNLVDPWGISLSTGSPFWVSNHLSATSTLYNGAGAITPLVVKIPAAAASPTGAVGRPTGQVQNNLSTAGMTPSPTATYTFTTANNKGDAAFNQLLGVNNAGTIVGYFGDGEKVPNFGYSLAPPSTYTSENYPAAAQTQVIGINNTDTGAPPANVGFYVDANGNNFGFVYNGGVFTSVNNPLTPSGGTGTTTNQLLAINDAGMAAGFYIDGNGNAQGYTYNIFNKVYSPVTLPASFNAAATTASGINNAGTVAGFFTDTSDNVHGFVGSAQTFTRLDAPNGSNTMAFGLNNQGQVVGTYVDANGVNQGFIYFTATKAWQTVSPSNASATAAFGVSGTLINGINDYGTVVGFYSDGANVNGFYATTTGDAPTPFLLPAPNGKAASFIFATDDGSISAWNGSVVASTAVITIDNSAAKAVYKGLAIGASAVGPTIYAANFRSGKIEAYTGSWASATLAGTFTDPTVPAGFAPFNIWNLGGKLYVTYAKQDSNKFLDVAGAGNGYVAVFDLNGNLLTHLVSGGVLNSPWGVAIAPATWGAFGGALLVGNFGDGTINAFNATTGAALGTLMSPGGTAISNSGLWAIVFGNGGSGGDTNTLYFAAGEPSGSNNPHGLLGAIAPPATITSIQNAASLISGNIAPGEMVLINGQSVGPSPRAVFDTPIPAMGSLPTMVNPTTPVNTTSVTFNGTPAPVIYAGSAGTAVQVPYEIAGSTSASVVMTVGSQTTPAFTATVAPTAPGLFTLDFSGKGALVAMNADGTINSAANPAARGAMITIFATGEGVTNPVDKDGVVETSNGDVPTAAMGMSIGGVFVTMPTASSLPKDVSGVLQIPVTVPNLFATGAVNVTLVVGGVQAPNTTFIYIK